ncbi:MAG: hypothetical protein KC766_06010 [Myxococcales bacterium]|nr:hypothetical protein [Myxococcales bacterium]
MLNPHGKAQLSRALWIGLALYALAVALTWATDEADASWGQRAARLGALGPLLAALATWGSGQLARTRGEARALLALGATPAALERGAVLGGWLLALGGLVIALGPWADQHGLFPALESGRNWHLLADGTLADPLGARFSAGTGLVPVAPQTPPRSVDLRLATACFLLPLVVALPPWVVALQPSLARLWRAGLALFLASGLALWLLHGVAASRLPWLSLLLTPLPLIVEYRLRKLSAA